MKALESLYALGALDDHGELTKLGRKMAEFPLDPMMSKALLAADELGCSEEVATIVSMLSVQNSVFFRPKERKEAADNAKKAFFDPHGDHLTLLKVFNGWVDSNYAAQWCFENFVQLKAMKKARDIRDQIIALMERVELSMKTSHDSEMIRKVIYAESYFQLNV